MVGHKSQNCILSGGDMSETNKLRQVIKDYLHIGSQATSMLLKVRDAGVSSGALIAIAHDTDLLVSHDPQAVSELMRTIADIALFRESFNLDLALYAWQSEIFRSAVAWQTWAGPGGAISTKFNSLLFPERILFLQKKVENGWLGSDDKLCCILVLLDLLRTSRRGGASDIYLSALEACIDRLGADTPREIISLCFKKIRAT